MVPKIQSQPQFLLTFFNQTWHFTILEWQQRSLFSNSKICMGELSCTECRVSVHVYSWCPAATDGEANKQLVTRQQWARVWQIKRQLHKYGLTKVCVSTMCRWMHQLGFHYDMKEKLLHWWSWEVHTGRNSQNNIWNMNNGLIARSKSPFKKLHC